MAARAAFFILVLPAAANYPNPEDAFLFSGDEGGTGFRIGPCPRKRIRVQVTVNDPSKNIPGMAIAGMARSYVGGTRSQ
jgi:hypothetical protein